MAGAVLLLRLQRVEMIRQTDTGTSTAVTVAVREIQVKIDNVWSRELPGCISSTGKE